ncbi:MAG: glycosyltransferase [Acutalibacteraceae bacterium]|jgi:1,2-diacylglycerol 3-alpha-glucosyltransferase
MRVGLFNDSFPPMIDGVAQTVKNYALNLQKNHAQVTVVTPKYRDVKDDYPFEVYRYQSIPVGKRVGYRAGNPIEPKALMQLRRKHFDIMHVHAPFASSVLVKNLNHLPRVPVVLTYHTKFEVDIAKRVPNRGMQKVALDFVKANINAVDEVWAVTERCGQSLRDIGYKGRYLVMENGTDFAYGQASADAVGELRAQYEIPDDAFVFLFVGRMMWYKNVRLILDALKIAKDAGLPFRMFMIGDGFDAPAIRDYATECGVGDETIFTGPIFDREKLRVFYSLADIFLFPSTYDTSGIVVKEAAACDCPTLLVEGSCAAEGAINDFSAFLAQENAESCGAAILRACQSRERLAQVGRQAGQSLYLSWETAVSRAYARYEEILRTWPGPLPYNSRSAKRG